VSHDPSQPCDNRRGTILGDQRGGLLASTAASKPGAPNARSHSISANHLTSSSSVSTCRGMCHQFNQQVFNLDIETSLGSPLVIRVPRGAWGCPGSATISATPHAAPSSVLEHQLVFFAACFAACSASSRAISRSSTSVGIAATASAKLLNCTLEFVFSSHWPVSIAI
jgi:hypothetical protein